MERYNISYERGRGKVRERDPGPSDTTWKGVREHWTRSHKGAFLSSYEAGVTLAKADLDAGTNDNRDLLLAVEVEDRDLAWEAQRDGYLDTIGEGKNVGRLDF